MTTAREEASSAIDELEKFVQRLEQEWKDAKERLDNNRAQLKALPEDDAEGFGEIWSDCAEAQGMEVLVMPHCFTPPEDEAAFDKWSKETLEQFQQGDPE